MHEKILQGVTIGIVAGLAVYWLTSNKHTAGDKDTGHGDYKPTYGDVRTVRFGSGTCACCQCCGLITPQTNSNPLASDYLCCSPDYAPATSKWNMGISLQLSCEGIDLHSGICRTETATSMPFGIGGPNRIPRPVRLTQRLQCSPPVPVTVECTEVV